MREVAGACRARRRVDRGGRSWVAAINVAGRIGIAGGAAVILDEAMKSFITMKRPRLSLGPASKGLYR
jgi:hypothetical protein